MDEVMEVVSTTMLADGAVVVMLAGEESETRFTVESVEAARRYKLGRKFRVRATSYAGPKTDG